MEVACYTGGACKKRPSKKAKRKEEKGGVAGVEKGCDQRVCTVQTTMEEMVIEGDLSLL